ncbi:NUDIX hydrolase [Lacihabitans sp. CS3-21]|uniref:NUDIX hydrolase n=1 Tax=Lacihabitans sp. CS3-21 TaxID=2487332 RepID=UPI0020CE1700|nr:NUDIX hydrolase [Lacihabitans sp. CS3-21]MCP9745810.1 NUDIX domain-containing protein [Lacihabitans sp. CS3-21]
MKKILELIASYNGIYESEKLIKKRFIEFVQKYEDCFERHLLVGHITASAFIFDKKNNKILLLHHKKLNKWLQPGGHCDGDKDTLSVAIKEVFEETGLVIKNQAQPIFDLDIHMIPENKGIPEHEHFDVRYLLLADSKIPLIQNHETNQLKWVDLSEMENYTSEESLRRMKNKLTLV